MTPTAADKASPTAPLRRLWHGWLKPYSGWIALNLVAIAGVAASTSGYPLLINWAFERVAVAEHAEAGVAGAQGAGLADDLGLTVTVEIHDGWCHRNVPRLWSGG